MIPAKNRWIVLYRDSFACQDCASKARFFDQFGRLHEKGLETDLEVHHINGHSDNLDNLISLCSECHLQEAHNGDWRNQPVKKYSAKKVTPRIIELALRDFLERQRFWYNYFSQLTLADPSDIAKMGESLAKKGDQEHEEERTGQEFVDASVSGLASNRSFPL
ncbi:MAG: HNH endonuclease [Candidatus Bathyarchaeia archaeon]